MSISARLARAVMLNNLFKRPIQYSDVPNRKAFHDKWTAIHCRRCQGAGIDPAQAKDCPSCMKNGDLNDNCAQCQGIGVVGPKCPQCGGRGVEKVSPKALRKLALGQLIVEGNKP